MVLAKFEIWTRLATIILWAEVRVKQNDFYSISFRRLEIQHGYNSKFFNLKLVTGEFPSRWRCWSSCPTVAFPQHFFRREPPKRICYIPRNPFPGISSETRLQRGNWQCPEITPVLPVAGQKEIPRYFYGYAKMLTVLQNLFHNLSQNPWRCSTQHWLRNVVLRQDLDILKQNAIYIS
jgi:hypothetical protein